MGKQNEASESTSGASGGEDLSGLLPPAVLAATAVTQADVQAAVDQAVAVLTDRIDGLHLDVEDLRRELDGKQSVPEGDVGDEPAMFSEPPGPEKPRYRLTERSHIADRIVEPGQMIGHGTAIPFDGIPAPHMIPLNAPARDAVAKAKMQGRYPSLGPVGGMAALDVTDEQSKPL